MPINVVHSPVRRAEGAKKTFLNHSSDFGWMLLLSVLFTVFCSSLLHHGTALSFDGAMQGGTLRMCTMGDEVNQCVTRRRRPYRRLKGVSVAYGPAYATATHYLLLQ